MQQREEAALRSRRSVVPLSEGKSIGLELDFCAEVRPGTFYHSLMISMYFI